jgi:hypothetical protein
VAVSTIGPSSTFFKSLPALLAFLPNEIVLATSVATQPGKDAVTTGEGTSTLVDEQVPTDLCWTFHSSLSYFGQDG